MFLTQFKKIKSNFSENTFLYFLLLFCVLLPFQFALNPAPGIDMAIVRVFLPVLFLSYLAFILKNNLPFPKLNNVTASLLVFLFLAIISISFSHNIIWSLKKLLFLFSIAPAYFLAVSLLNTFNRQRLAVTAFVGGATILALIAITQFFSQFIFGINAVYAFLGDYTAPFFLGRSFSEAVLAYPSWLINSGGTTYMRAVAIFPDPHMLSYYFGILIPWSIALWSISITHKKWFFVSTLLLVIGDILTFTRGGYIALIVGALAILPLVSMQTAKKIIAGSGIIIILFMLAPHNPVVGRLSSSFDAKEGSNQARLGNWQQAILIISQHPFGVGIGGYSLAVDPAAAYREPIYAHNLYLDISAELGLPAALVFILILIFAFMRFWKLSKNQPFFIAGVASVTIFAAHSMVENPMYSVHILPLFLIIFALSISAPYEKISNPE